MAFKLPDELKKAVSDLPSKEKDKLIFRLLRNDYILANRMLFELVSNESTEERREKVSQNLTTQIERQTMRLHSSKGLYQRLRYMSAEITEHVKITKDKYGEVELNLFMLNSILEKHTTAIAAEPKGKSYKFCIYVIVKIFRIMILAKKLDADLLADFNVAYEKLGDLIGDNPSLMDVAIKNGLDVNWLFSGDVPNDIEARYKELRENGFLK
jgi:hypothetical protein